MGQWGGWAVGRWGSGAVGRWDVALPTWFFFPPPFTPLLALPLVFNSAFCSALRRLALSSAFVSNSALLGEGLRKP